jgi:hypothetical protein
MITAILSLLGSSAFGSIIGGIFAFLNKKSDLETKRLELEHERNKWAHDLQVKDKDLDYARIEAQGRKEVAIVEGDYAAEVARMGAIGQSFEADKLDAATLKEAGKLKGWLIMGKSAQAWIRPVLTVVLTSAAIYLNWVLIAKLTEQWPALDKAQQFEMGMQAFAWITGQASAALGYWFVSRGTGK